ncbi:MAG TPA: PilT/PilU family type 4a pilus ATPase, partial [Candidatus Dormibacteraeota bacterium]
MTIDEALDRLLELAGSDLLISCGTRARIRKDGSLETLDGDSNVLEPADTSRMVREVLDAKQWKELEKKRHVDFSFTWRGRARIRGNAYHQRNSIAAAFRLLPLDIPSFDMLGIPESVHRLLERQHGLLLVTGPTGSGKSTTQAAIIDHINATRPYHVITIEDPIEYVHKHRLSIVDQRQVGEDTPSFADGLRAAFREDPDVVLIGEMRDLETITAAVSIAESGHLVLATLHTNDAPQALDRIIDSYLG